MRLENQTFTIPSTWTPPKYRFGQLVKQGEIVGMEYYASGTNRAFQHGEGWLYWIALDSGAEETETFQESSIKPLNPEEIKVLIQTEIESHSQRVAVLTEQLEIVQLGGEYGKP